MAWVQKYNKSVAKSQRFTCLHLDVEPWASSDWWDPSRNAQLVHDYQSYIMALLDRSQSMGLSLMVDTNAYNDTIFYANDYGQ